MTITFNIDSLKDNKALYNKMVKDTYRDTIKTYCELSAVKEHPDNLQNVHTPYFLCQDIVGKLKEYAGDFAGKTFAVLNIEFIEVLCYDFDVKPEMITFVTDSPSKKHLMQQERYKGVEIMDTNDFFQLAQESVSNMPVKSKKMKKKAVANTVVPVVKTEIVAETVVVEEKKDKSQPRKWDYVIGNPPYQAPKERQDDTKTGSCGGELWDKFVEKSLEICKENGFISLIHPPKWRKPGHNVFPKIKDKDIKYIEMHNLDDGMKTFNAATAYDWYVIQNCRYNGNTVIKDVNGDLNNIDLTYFDYVPSSHFELFSKLLAKNEEEKCEVIYSRGMYGHDKKNMSPNKDEIFQYPCIYGITQKNGLKIIYSNEFKGHFGVNKVIIPLSKFTDAYIDEGKYGVCEFTFGIKFDTLEEAEGIKKAVMSEEFKKIWQATEWICNSKEWRIFKYFRRDFWKQFVN